MIAIEINEICKFDRTYLLNIQQLLLLNHNNIYSKPNNKLLPL